MAADLALRSLREGSSSSAIVGGVNLMLSPHLFICFSKARMLSPDCRCFTFDQRANGYARGEGAGVVYLRPLAAALAEQSPVLAILKGSAVNHGGRSASLTAPSGPSQQAVLRAALRASRCEPHQISLCEAHGTGERERESELGCLRDFQSEAPSALLPFEAGSVGSASAVQGLRSETPLKLALSAKCIPWAATRRTLSF